MRDFLSRFEYFSFLSNEIGILSNNIRLPDLNTITNSCVSPSLSARQLDGLANASQIETNVLNKTVDKTIKGAWKPVKSSWKPEETQDYDRVMKNEDGSLMYGYDDTDTGMTDYYNENGELDCRLPTPSDDEQVTYDEDWISSSLI